MSSAQLHLTITLSRLNRSVNGGARSKLLDHPQHLWHMLDCLLQEGGYDLDYERDLLN